MCPLSLQCTIPSPAQPPFKSWGQPFLYVSDRSLPTPSAQEEVRLPITAQYAFHLNSQYRSVSPARTVSNLRENQVWFCPPLSSNAKHNAWHVEGTQIFAEPWIMEGRCIALQSGLTGDSYNIENLLMATYSFWGRFSSGRKTTFPNWHKNERVKDELSNGGNAHHRHIHKPSVWGCGEIPPPPPAIC